MNSNLNTILGFLTGHGLTPAQAAGVAGNLQVESGYNPAASNPREGAIGIAQWEGGRRTALDNYARATGGTETDLNTQLGYLWTELQGSESNAYRKLIATQDPGTAAAAFDQFYERSSGAARASRVAAAQAVAADPGTAGAVTLAAAKGGNSSGSALVTGTSLADTITKSAFYLGGGVLAGVLVIVGLKSTVKG